ncbi:MAG: molybdenum cofactor biosynthesis protein MoaE [Geminicoccaceae bacterium]|nr:molybdenum cofactor biosynthesis protein MoaE [Geminicoccaceae bacterium]
MAFTPGEELDAFIRAGRADEGAVVSFTGLVRDMALNDGLKALTLEHYPGMTERQLIAIADEALTRFGLHRCLVLHRYGRMSLREPIVFVATSAAHRGSAFEAACFLMDWLKTKAPFWKLEETAEGERWVDARAEDDAAAARWVS